MPERLINGYLEKLQVVKVFFLYLLQVLFSQRRITCTCNFLKFDSWSLGVGFFPIYMKD